MKKSLKVNILKWDVTDIERNRDTIMRIITQQPPYAKECEKCIYKQAAKKLLEKLRGKGK